MARTKSTKAWRAVIRKNCEEVGTYRSAFEPVISTLAEILAQRDKALMVYERSGANPVITHTNKAGGSNLEQNPLLRMANDLNRDALAYWRDLGLTPAGLRKINEEALKPKTRSSLEEVLENLAEE